MKTEEKIARLGMWVFLCTEMMLFSVIFTTVFVVRFLYPDICNEATRHLNLPIGAANTAILLTSSYLVALAVRKIKEQMSANWLFHWAAFLGLCFLVLKAVEYWLHYKDGLFPVLNWSLTHYPQPQFELFILLYFIATMVHALHLLIGIAALEIAAIKKVSPVATEMIALYWHFVDVIWIFLFPTLYLWGR